MEPPITPRLYAHPSTHRTCTSLNAMAVSFPEVTNHPNRLPFEGCLTLVDTASDKPPSGARGHRVVLTRTAAERALPSLLGMAVDYKAGWDGHDARQKCGIITAAHLEDRRLMVAGFVFARDFPEVHQHLEANATTSTTMGMSFELADAHVADMRAPSGPSPAPPSPEPPSSCAAKPPTAKPPSASANAAAPQTNPTPTTPCDPKRSKALSLHPNLCVISTEAKRSGETSAFRDASQSKTARARHQPSTTQLSTPPKPLCHLDRSEAQWRDLQHAMPAPPQTSRSTP